MARQPDNKAAAKFSSDDGALIRELALLLDETSLTEIEIERAGLRVRVARNISIAASMPVNLPSGGAPAHAAPVGVTDATEHPGAVPSPMVGTVYLSPEPGRPVFVTVGKTVKEGDTLFIVEAMKTMNAITAPKGGTVREINVEDGSPVEFGQTLCVIA